MAFRDMIHSTDARTFLESNFFYNLGSSVGYGCSNKPNDVRLVQYFLNVYNTGWESRILPQIEVDGDFGGQTWRTIKTFQEIDLAINGHGMVSSVNRRYTSPKHGQWYTIMWLNSVYRQTYPQFLAQSEARPELSGRVKRALIRATSAAGIGSISPFFRRSEGVAEARVSEI